MLQVATADRDFDLDGRRLPLYLPFVCWEKNLTSESGPALNALTPPRSHGLIDSLTDCHLSVIVCLYSFDCVYMLNFNAA